MPSSVSSENPPVDFHIASQLNDLYQAAYWLEHAEKEHILGRKLKEIINNLVQVKIARCDEKISANHRVEHYKAKKQALTESQFFSKRDISSENVITALKLAYCWNQQRAHPASEKHSLEKFLADSLYKALVDKKNATSEEAHAIKRYSQEVNIPIELKQAYHNRDFEAFKETVKTLKKDSSLFSWMIRQNPSERWISYLIEQGFAGTFEDVKEVLEEDVKFYAAYLIAKKNPNLPGLLRHFVDCITADSNSYCDNKKIVEIIKLVPDINARNDSGDTALHVTIKNTLPNVAFLLLQRGADVNLTDGKGKTALHLVLENKNLWEPKYERFISNFLAYPKIDWKAKIPDTTPLHLLIPTFKSIIRNSIEEAFTGFGVNPAVKVRPTYVNIVSIFEEVFSKLSDSLILPNSEGQTPLHLLFEWFDSEQSLIRSYLKGLLATRKHDILAYRDKDKNSFVHLATQNDYSKATLDFLIELGFTGYEVNKKHQTILHLNAKKGRSNLFLKASDQPTEEMLVGLLKKDSKGNTPLHIAAKHGYLGKYKKFRDDALYSIKNNKEQTILDVAKAYLYFDDAKAPG